MPERIPFILVTGSVSEEFAAGIIKSGADDYILKDQRKSNERFQTLCRVTKDAIWDWDLRTDEVWWNESFYRLLGYNPELPVPPPSEWTKQIHHADRSKVMARLQGVA